MFSKLTASRAARAAPVRFFRSTSRALAVSGDNVHAPKEGHDVELTDGRTGKKHKFPILKGTIGPDVIDFRSLYAKTDMFSHDPGFTSTSSCESSISYIDGDAGVLLHRGYPIDQLATHSSYMEVCYLLLNGKLPNKAELAEFEDIITNHSMVHEKYRDFLSGYPRNSHPMAVMLGAVGSLSAFYRQETDIETAKGRAIVAHRLVAKMPTLAAWAYKYSKGQPFMYPQNKLSYAERFLNMMYGTPCQEWEPQPIAAKALDKIFILHADHEQNASTSTVRIAGSSYADPYACITAGVASLWGRAHGGANEDVLIMLKEIGHKDNIPKFIARSKDKKDTYRLKGFGHRVYKNFDPRSKIMQKACHDVLGALGITTPQLELAMELERIALSDPYFIERKLYPNVDFYSGIVLSALKIPTDMFTVIFALSRTVGWISHWNESIISKDFKISRPRQVYRGSPKRDYVPINQR